jgi:hypothetical protein
MSKNDTSVRSIGTDRSITPQFNIPVHDEARLRALANELAKDIMEAPDILKSLGIEFEEYETIKETRAFKELYIQALAEWQSAANTQKRVKLKAATAVEAALPTFWKDFNNPNENLNARVGLLTTLAKIGGLGQGETADRVALPGQTFKLEIHLSGKDEPLTIVSGATATEEMRVYKEEEEGFNAFEEDP